jgi:hypothetical protein
MKSKRFLEKIWGYRENKKELSEKKSKGEYLSEQFI